MAKPKKNIGYEKRFCLFLDILGFKSHVEVSASPDASSEFRVGAMDFSRLLGVLKHIAEGMNYRQAIQQQSGKITESSRRVTQFSDSIVISYLAAEKFGLADILYDVLKLHLELMHRGILFRGGIASGDLYHNETLVFGPALNQAVALEALANYPRVVVDRDVLALAQIKPVEGRKNSFRRTASTLLQQDLDGLYFVDYFAVLPEDFNDDWGDLCFYMNSLRECIKLLSSKKDLSLKLKYSWMRHKFNEVAKPLALSQFTEFAGSFVPEEEFDEISRVTPFV